MALNKLLVMLLACAFAAPAVSQVSVGGIDCGQWVKSPTEARRFWLLGNMAGKGELFTGWMRAGVDYSDPPNFASSPDQIYLWMDNFCLANPLKSVGDGANVLSSELLRTWTLVALRGGARDTFSGPLAFGASDCGQWVRAPTDTAKAWLLGFMSGMNTLLGRNADGTPLDPKEAIDPLAAVNWSPENGRHEVC